MSKIGTIKLKNLTDLVDQNETKYLKEDQLENLKETVRTPVNKNVERRLKNERVAAATTSRKIKKVQLNAEVFITANRTTVKRSPRTLNKEPPPSQLRIDSFFKSSSKSFYIAPELSTANKENTKKPINSKTKKGATKGRGAGKRKGRKRLFEDTTDTETTTSLSCFEVTTPPKTKPNRKRKTKTPVKPIKNKSPKVETKREATVFIDLDSEAENVKDNVLIKVEPFATIKEVANSVTPPAKLPNEAVMVAIPLLSPMAVPPIVTSDVKICKVETSSKKLNATTAMRTAGPTTRSRQPRLCPPYKVVAGTNFAVDAFQYGQIEGVTHYFLTHFHADHYVGLTRKFAMPLYLSPTTARLVRAFIPLEEQYLHEIEVNEPVVIEGVEVTAIEANHCPGAIMLVFKLPNGKCILHTGDFRASAEMESEPIFWNNDIDTIYLDTTYISNKYAFCTQYESIHNAMELIRQFRNKHQNKRILYVCGAYVIGKEKFWHALAAEFWLTVWTEGNRKKALEAMNLEGLPVLQENPLLANMHILSMGQLSYLSLVEYFKPYSNNFDLLLAIRPSGWEKNSRPQYRGQINIIGTEYSEHSSHDELQRFVTYLCPREVISTVPVGRDLMVTGTVPKKWYNYDILLGIPRNFQPSITSYLKLKTKQNENNNSPANENKNILRKKNCILENELNAEQDSPLQLGASAFSNSRLRENEISSQKSIKSKVVLQQLNSQVFLSPSKSASIKVINIATDAEEDWFP